MAAIAEHAIRAGDDDRVWVWAREAAARAMAASAVVEAEELLVPAVAAGDRLGLGPDEMVPALRDLASSAERAGHPMRALATLRLAARRCADPVERGRLRVDEVRVLEKLGRYREALSVTTRALSGCEDPEVQAHLRLSRATVRNFQGRWQECLDLATGLIAEIGPDGDPALLGRAHLLAEMSSDSLGRPERADHERAALALLATVDDPVALGNLLLNRGVSAFNECRFDDALESYRASTEHYGRAGDVVGAALCDNNRAEILTLQFRLDLAEELLIPAGRVLVAGGYPLGVAIVESGRSRIDTWRGDLGSALERQERALAAMVGLNADEYVLDSQLRLIEIAVLAGDAGLGRTLCDDAGDRLQRLGEVAVAPATLDRLRGRVALLSGDRHGRPDVVRVRRRPGCGRRLHLRGRPGPTRHGPVRRRPRRRDRRPPGSGSARRPRPSARFLTSARPAVAAPQPSFRAEAERIGGSSLVGQTMGRAATPSSPGITADRAVEDDNLPMPEIDPLFDRLPDEERRALRSAARRRKFGRGDPIFYEGDLGNSLHIIEKGHVAIRVSTPLGDEVTLTVMGVGEAFGEIALLSEDSRRTAAAVCLEQTETLSLGAREFADLRVRLPLVDRFLLEVLSTQVQRLSGLLLESLYLDANARIYRRLHALNISYGGEAAAVAIPVTQEDLASMAGATRPTVNKALKVAEGDGIVALTRGRITVVDADLLARRAGL